MPDRKYQGPTYRYGFNGKEMDNEVKGAGAQYDYGFRIYDPRIQRFLSVDPLMQSYPWYTPYQFAGNMPIWAIDLDGLEELKATRTQVVQIFDVKGNLIKTPQKIEFGASGNTIIVAPNRQLIQQGDDGGPDIELISEWRQVEGNKFYNVQYIVHKAFNPEPNTKNNTVHTNDNDEPVTTPPTPRKPADVMTWQYGQRTAATPITQTNSFEKSLNVEFQLADRNNPGTGFVDKSAAIAAITDYANELKTNGITSINLTISTKFYNWDSYSNYPDYSNASDLIAARAVVIKRLFAANGIAVTNIHERYNTTPSISAVATKATTTVIGYDVSTTPIKRKVINGKPVGTPRIDGGTRRSTSTTLPKTGDTWRK